MKNYIIVLICFFVVTGTSISYASGSEGTQAEQPKEGAQAESAEPEKKYELIETTKEYLISPKGAFLYYCSPCHGKSANGKGIYFTIDLKPSPTDLTNVEYMAALTDDYLVNFITQGSAAMEKSNAVPSVGRNSWRRYDKGHYRLSEKPDNSKIKRRWGHCFRQGRG